jgi:hypothetical protein
MDIHKPHAAKSWREFFIEIGTIVIGILIALGLEQLIETIHWHNEVKEAEAAIDAEILTNVGYSYVEAADFNCVESQLDRIGAALAANRDHGQPVPIMPAFRRPLIPFLDDAWRATLASGVANHIPRDKLAAYSGIYLLTNQLRDNAEPHDFDAMDRLNTLTVNAGRLQPAERDRLFQALVFERRNVLQGTFTAVFAIDLAKQSLGITLSPKRKAELAAAEMVKNLGKCVHEPMSLQEARAMFGSNYGRGGPLVQPK